MNVYKILRIQLLSGFADILSDQQIITLMNRKLITYDTLKFSSISEGIPLNLELRLKLIMAKNEKDAHKGVLSIIEPLFNGVLSGIPKECIGYVLGNVEVISGCVIDPTQWWSIWRYYKLTDGTRC